MGSLNALALAVPEHDGAISSTTGSAAADGLIRDDGLVDALGGDDMPWHAAETRATSPADLPSLGPSTPRTGLSLDHIDPDPILANTSSTFLLLDPPLCFCTDEDDGLHACCRPSSLNDATQADCVPLYRTFFLSPSTSTSSLVSARSDSWSTSPSWELRETGETWNDAMPGPTLVDGSFDHAFSDAADFSPLPAFATPDMTARSSPVRPRSAESGADQAASPMFARWSRRHHHNHSHHDGPLLRSKNGPGRVFTEGKQHASKPSSLSRTSSIQKRQPQPGAVPQMTREEFEALPLAIQRKYFSTLERLRFAQESGLVDGISRHYNDISISHYKRRKPRQDRSVSEQLTSRSRRPAVLGSQFTASDSSPSTTGLTDSTHGSDLSRETQVVLARRLRASVILDAADEAVYKLNQKASRRNLGATIEPPLSPVSSMGLTMDSNGDAPMHDRTLKSDPNSFFDSFRWMDEEEDLDLRLFLDDYHANLREGVPTSTNQRPSFRRHLSITKIPFGRSSVSSSRPGTKDAMTPASPILSPASSAGSPIPPTRRKSRALSLITPKHAPQPSITTIDPAAAHYQDPEARLKLRVYLASPQKFDEAIEFGFPATDVLSPAGEDKENVAPDHRPTKSKLSNSHSNMRSFLDDDEDDIKLSLDVDKASLADPDSPKTPHTLDNKAGVVRPMRLSSVDHIFGREMGNKTLDCGGYAQAPAASREMTLRMTLTRPDLRAHEEEIYGWQQRQDFQQHGRKPTAMTLGLDNSAAYYGDASQKESLDRAIQGIDHWSPTTTDKGVMKRIWNRMRRA